LQRSPESPQHGNRNLSCIVETTNFDVITYEALRGKSGEVKASEKEPLKRGITKEYIEDFIDDVEHAEGAICGEIKRLDAYLEILDIIGL